MNQTELKNFYVQIGIIISKNISYGKNQYVVPTENGWGVKGENK